MKEKAKKSVKEEKKGSSKSERKEIPLEEILERIVRVKPPKRKKEMKEKKGK